MNTSPRLRKETALFAEVSYDITDQWRAVVGARAFEFDFETLDHFIGSTLLAANNEIFIEGEAKEDDIVPKFRLEYRPNDDMLFFATAAEGFRMGGANFPIPTNVPSCAAEVEAIFGVPEVPNSYESDSLWSYELGGKLTFADGRVRVNAAAFYIDWKDQQVPTGTLCRFSGAVLNVGEVESKGFELEVQAAATDRLTFMVSGSYIDAEIKEDFQLPGATVPPFAFAGDPLPDIPDWSGAFMADYRFPAFGDWEGFVRGDYRYTAERSGNILNTFEKEAYGEGNLHFGITDANWEIMLYVENVTDERPTLNVVTGGLAGHPIELTLVPRTYGVTVRRNF
jgi:outer membrane receptor protein involved in Fe transport